MRPWRSVEPFPGKRSTASRKIYEQAQAPDAARRGDGRTAPSGAARRRDQPRLIPISFRRLTEQWSRATWKWARRSRRAQTTPLFLVAADLTVMQVNANVSENDIGEVKLGDKASFTVEAFPNRSFAGEVTQIGRSPADYPERRELRRRHQRAQSGSVAQARHERDDPDRDRQTRRCPPRTQ